MASIINATAFHYDGHTFVRLNAGAPADGLPMLPPLHIGFLIDTSGSMQGSRITAVKRTLEAARPLFRDTDTVSLVSFASHGTTHLARQRLDAAGIDSFYMAVNSLTPAGSTNLSAGIEKLSEIGTDFTTLLLLTDGQVNMGVRSVAGLNAMATGVCSGAINTLGYGADHSRRLLSGLAVASRGSYTYADADEVLPIVIGDIMAGLRTEVARQVSVSVVGSGSSPAIECQEVGATGATYAVGSVVADRDYWIVFRGSGPRILVRADSGFVLDVSVPAEESTSSADIPMLREQLLRVRVAKALTATSDALEDSRVDSSTLDMLQAIRAEITDATDEVRSRPLVLRMTGQIEEALAAVTEMIARRSRRSLLDSDSEGEGARGGAGARAIVTPHLAARLSSGATCLTTQRGYLNADGCDAIAVEPGQTCMFSSPSQLTGSRAVRDTYTHDPRSTSASGLSSLE